MVTKGLAYIILYAFIVSLHLHIIAVPPGQTGQINLPPPSGTGPTTNNFNINITPHNIINTGATANSGSSSLADAQSTSTVFNNNRNILSQWMRSVKELSPSISQSVVTWLQRHKLHVGASTLGTTYAFLNFIIIKGNYFLHDDTRWALWNEHISLEDLAKLPHDTLGKELIHAIQQRHINQQNPMEHLSPLINFLREIRTERSILNRYIIIVTVLKQSRLILIFPANDNTLKRAKNLRKRLDFVHHVFLSWTATDKMGIFRH